MFFLLFAAGSKLCATAAVDGYGEGTSALLSARALAVLKCDHFHEPGRVLYVLILAYVFLANYYAKFFVEREGYLHPIDQTFTSFFFAIAARKQDLLCSSSCQIEKSWQGSYFNYMYGGRFFIKPMTRAYNLSTHITNRATDMTDFLLIPATEIV